MTPDEQLLELEKCAQSFPYFVHMYCQIYDAEAKNWIPFKLWKEQYDVAKLAMTHKLLIALKARQIGMTWLFLAFGLWLMLFHPIATILIFSKRDDEAVYLLGEERLRGMYARLPEWMQAEAATTASSHVWQLSNGSVARAFPTTGGDGYTATFVLVDEADLVPDLPRLMRAVKPTIDAGGWLALISRSNKDEPNSLFKNIYRVAKQGTNEWKAVFLAWWVRPERTPAWYEALKNDTRQNTGSLDDVYEQYPATDEEALRSRELNKRIYPNWFDGVYSDIGYNILSHPKDDTPPIPGLKVFDIPRWGHRYVVSLDCAEGLPASDDSATDVIDIDTGEQVATFAGKIAPEVHAEYAGQLARWYNHAPLLPENNSIGYAAVTALIRDGFRVLEGHDHKAGWTSSAKGKVILYTNMAAAIKNKEVTIHDFETLTQLQSIEASTLLAPEGDHDDRADAFALANQGRLIVLGGGSSGFDSIPADSKLGELLG
jgi:hypothetical protein